MNETQDILYGIASQPLYFDAPEGRASSIVSSQVFARSSGDDDTAENALAGSEAVEANPNTTLDDAAAVGATTIPLTATTGIVRGRRYLITSSTSAREWVEVTDVGDGVSVSVREPIKNAYASGDAFVSTRITDTVATAWVSDKTNISAWNKPNAQWRWVLTYVVDGVTYRHHVWFDVVRVKGQHTVTGLDVDRAYMGQWLDALGTYYRKDQGAAIIADAYRAVKLHLYAHGKADQMVRNPEVIDDLVLHEAAMRVPTLFEQASERYRYRFDGLIASPKIEFDDGQEGGSSPASQLPILRR